MLFRSVVLLAPIKHLVLQSPEEGLHDAVVITVPLSGHGLYDAFLFDRVPEIGVLVLPTLVGMKDQALKRREFTQSFLKHSLDLLHVWSR